jgi:hypothetical protein
MHAPIRELDTVILLRDIPSEQLHRGDRGAVVTVYAPGEFDVEFVSVDGATSRLLTLGDSDLRLAGEDDVNSARHERSGRAAL